MAPRSGPVPGLIGRGLARVYTAEVARRNRAFDAGRGVDRIEVPVISVGNLSVGGTGKTPMVMWVVERLRSMGRRPAIAMRGYGPKRSGASDEEAEYAARLRGVPIIANPDRIRGVRELRAVAPDTFDCVVLDDGFQHRRMARDLDIVLIDSTRNPFQDRCLPAGWLREPVESLARADAVVLTRADLASEALDGLSARVSRIAPSTVIARAFHRWTSVEVIEPNGQVHTHGPEWVTGRSIVVACGIANPGAFRRQLDSYGSRVIESVVLGDHAAWTESEVARVRAVSHRANAVVVTGKDWVKLRGRQLSWGVPIAHPRVDMAFGSGEAELEALIAGAIGPRSGDTI